MERIAATILHQQDPHEVSQRDGGKQNDMEEGIVEEVSNPNASILLYEKLLAP